MRSELGNQLALVSKNKNFRAIAAVVYIEEEMADKTKYKVSLRSLDNNDTTVISKEFGGGGHLAASSFAISIEEFEKNWKVVV